MTLVFKSADSTRIGAGLLSTSTILGSSSYLVTNWTRTTDMANTPLYWQAITENISDGIVEQSVDGSGGLHGFASGVIKFAHLTPNMAFHIFNTILSGKYINDVTISVFHPVFGQSEYTCKMEFPTALKSVGEQVNASIYTNVQFRWFRGTLLGNGFTNGFSNGFG